MPRILFLPALLPALARSLPTLALLTLATVALLTSGACATGYVYETVSTTGATTGTPETISPMLGGDVRVTSFGPVEIRPGGPMDVRSAVSLRLTVDNRSARAWQVDTRVQAIILGNGEESRAAYAVVERGTSPPIIVVRPGRTQVVDVLCPLPKGISSAKDLPSFDAVWSVRTPQGIVTGRVPFARAEFARRAYAEPRSVPPWLDPVDPRTSYVDLVELQGPHVFTGRATPP